ncbi:MAG: VWA domain-containing protein [Nanohaloarchaea archaeon]|nr:VWA domain-containing protein [Candidatus Nanohaloarchaea archaeon]
MQLIFTDQYASILLVMNALALLFYYGAKKKKRQRAMKFGNYSTLQKVAGKNFLKSSNVILVTRMLALTALIVGLSQPVIVQETMSSNSDYIIAMDSSSSMLESDLEPTRFRSSKTISQDFISRLSNQTRVGAVSFAGEVNKESGLTSEKQQVSMDIENTEIGSTAGTAIGDALYTSSSMLLETNRSRTVILITDGRNNVGSPLNESVEFANSHNVEINTVGIGESNRSTENFGTVDGQNASKAEFPNLNASKLRNISNSTGGEFVTASNSTSLENAFLSFEQKDERRPISRYFILLGAALLLIEWILGTTRYSILP